VLQYVRTGCAIVVCANRCLKRTFVAAVLQLCCSHVPVCSSVFQCVPVCASVLQCDCCYSLNSMCFTRFVAVVLQLGCSWVVVVLQCVPVRCSVFSVSLSYSKFYEFHNMCYSCVAL